MCGRRNHMRNIAVLAGSTALAFLTACGHVPEAPKPTPQEEAMSRAKLLIDARLEKAKIGNVTERLMVASSLMALFAETKQLKSEHCGIYMEPDAVTIPNEMKEAYSRAAYKMLYLNAIEEKELAEDIKKNELQTEAINENVGIIRAYCQAKFGA